MLIISDKPCANIKLFYKTAGIAEPSCYFAKKDDEVAVVAATVPTFDSKEPQDFFEVLKGEDESPEQGLAWEGDQFHFIFILDRSSSMWMSNRLVNAKNALELFIRSLPKGCKVSIVGFGSLDTDTMGEDT